MNGRDLILIFCGFNLASSFDDLLLIGHPMSGLVGLVLSALMLVFALMAKRAARA